MAFEKIVNNCREVGKEHDVVVGLSGGTDSTYMLFMLTTKYKLRVKAITFDNGYLSEQARNNINNTVEILKIEHEYIEFDENFRRETFNLSIIKTGAPCLGCSFAMYIAIHDYARTNNIPYIFMVAQGPRCLVNVCHKKIKIVCHLANYMVITRNTLTLLKIIINGI